VYILIVQSVTSLLLAGVACYWVFVSEAFADRRRTQQVWLGIIFGLAVIVLGNLAYVWDVLRAPLDAKSAPLIMAGYLGGPIGALITSTIAGLYRFSLGGPYVVLGTAMHILIPAVGLGIYYLKPPVVWPRVSKNALMYLLLGHAAIHIVPLVVFWMVLPAPGGLRQGLLSIASFGVVGTVSILVFWPILVYADRFACEAARSAVLARRLRLVLRRSIMGLSERKIGAGDARFDEGLLEVYGIPKVADLIDVQRWRNNIHPDDYDRYVKAADTAALGLADSELMDFRYLHPNGHQLEMRVNWVVERNMTGTPQSVLGLHADLTDIRNAERQHVLTAERLSVIAENLPGVMFQCDITELSNPQITFISTGCVSIWGFSVEEFLANGNIIFDAHDPASAPDFLSALKGAAASGEPIALRAKIHSHSGETRWLEYRGGVTSRDGRKILEAMAMDVTLEVEAQAQIEHEREIAYRAQKNESIGLLTGGVAHDFNNLLAVILGNLELLADDEAIPQRLKLIDGAIAATTRGADLTRNMLSFARQARLTPEVMDLNAVIAEAQSWIGRTLPQSISVETSLQADLWRVAVDRSSLESAVLNLILNARDAMSSQGCLTIETINYEIDETYYDCHSEELAPGRYVMLAVSDTGVGIPEKEISSIFEPFFSSKPPGLGTGLGLSMVLGFMRQSGGTTQVYSEVGVGTTFKLFFPANFAEIEDHVQVDDEDYGPDLRDKRILLAEDTTAVREMLVTMLERAGWTVTAASTGDQAFGIFQADPEYDLLLTDIVMPGTLQGTTLAKAIREMRHDMPVIFMSGYAKEATVHGNGLRTEDVRLMKPVKRREILKAVQGALKAVSS
jgi:signal transduction histidine kinase/CheY-like chemotaxis protein